VELAPKAGLRIEQRGLVMVARRPEARAVLEAFLQTEMGEGCELLEPEAARELCPMLAQGAIAGALWSLHEVRVESRDAIPALARYLEEALGVTFLRPTAVRSVVPPRIETSRGTIAAEAAVVCPGDDLHSLFADRLAPYGLTRCKLHMLRTVPQPDGWRLPAPVMSDLGLVRYLGYAALQEVAA
jgi:D-hydroxyproline dehydrogenase subunit beta